MEVKIGVIHANRELSVETNMTADDVERAMQEALSADGGVFRLTDDKGRSVHVPAEKLAYVELADDSGRRVGFGA